MAGIELLNLSRIDNIFDSHAHFDDERFDGQRDEILTEINKLGVCGIVNCAVDKESAKKCLEMSEKFDFCYTAIGVHPENIPCDTVDIKWIRDFSKNKRVVAIGEIGLDYHWDVPKELQNRWFEAQLVLANELEMPVIVHDREAHGDVLELLKKYRPKGVVHCFSGSAQMALEIIHLGMCIGIGGVVTFKNARKTVEVAKEIPLDHLLLETDSPYLAPEPFRSKTCHSALIPFTAKKIAEIRGCKTEEILLKSKENAVRLFNIK